LSHIPTIDLIGDPGSTCDAVDTLEVLAHPVDKVIFEDPFDQLVQQVNGELFKYIPPRKV
jgi:hypothetical protein